MSPPTKEEKILAWIADKPVGTQFYAQEVNDFRQEQPETKEVEG